MSDNHQFVNVTRTLIKRAATDIERKVAAGFVSGAIGYGIVNVLVAYGVKIPTTVAELIPYAGSVLGGWWVHSLGSVTTVHTTSSGATEVSTSTGSVKIPAFLPQPAMPLPVPPLPSPEPAPVADPAPLEVPDQAPVVEKRSVRVPADAYAATTVIDPNDRFKSILSNLPSATSEQDMH